MAMREKKSLKHVQVVPYDPNWPHLFQQAAQVIELALGDNKISIDHVGSTSVPGLSAKPKIDILTVVKDPKKAIIQLAASNVEYCGEYNIPSHYGFRMRGDVNVNLHVYEENHPEIELNLLFRDYLRKHPEAVKEYGELKKEILKDPSSLSRNSLGLPNYTLRKGPFIRNILKKAGFNQLRIIKCSDPYECKQVQKLCPKVTQELLEDLKYEHLALYQGCDVIGYARLKHVDQHHIGLEEIVFIDDSTQGRSQTKFMDEIKKWVESKDFTLSMSC